MVWWGVTGAQWAARTHARREGDKKCAKRDGLSATVSVWGS